MAAREEHQVKSLPFDVVYEQFVQISHPRVDKPLFRFPAYSEPDPANPSQNLFGVYHRLALDACRVITNHAANNQGDFLAEEREGKVPVPIDDAKPLSPRTYYYFLGPPEDATNRNYPIVKHFHAFRFPPQSPDNWYTARISGRFTMGQVLKVSSSHMATHIAARDQCCAATKYRDFNRCAHLVPKAEEAWFIANKMFAYAPDNEDAGIDAHTNGILLRDDVRRCFDSHAFVFYPAGNNMFVAYFVHTRGYPNYTELLHRRLVTIHPSVAVEFLYARFAYNVIHLSRRNAAFASIPENPQVRVWEGILKAEKDARKAAKLASIGEDTSMTEASEGPGASGGDEESDNESSASNQAIQSPQQEPYEDGDARWKERLFARLPMIATLEEVEHPPDTVACHTETPHMLRVKSTYLKEHPQVWQTSTTPEGAMRGDREAILAAWMTRPGPL
ncbi:hypothetical protein LXA43DRAFT_901310 [Ganoderma leucocontextum]|nr:hypothetical protein LXA43DRAFT_901310 [Ganoderma leucocontextum]